MTLKELSYLQSLDTLMHEAIARIESGIYGTADEKAELERLFKQYADERRRIFAYINSVEDCLVRAILTLRIVDGMSWASVAKAIGGRNTEDSVKKVCYRHLQQDH